MMDIDQLRGWDDEIHAEFETYFPNVFRSRFSKQYPVTTLLSTQFTVSTNFIKNSIFNCAENDDLFGVKILFRSQIEHYLRFSYIWFNWMKQKSDDTSRRYLEYSAAREVLDSIKSQVSEIQLSNPDFMIKDWDDLLNQFPNLKVYSRNEIEKETLKYTYKNIVKVLKQIDEFKEHQTTFFGSIIKEYTSLSSFVHGSIGSHDELLRFNEETRRMAEYLRVCTLTFQMAGTVKLFSLLMFVQTDKKDFASSYLKLDRLIKRASGIEKIDFEPQ